MPKIIVEASPAHGAAREQTFSERIVTQNLRSGHYSSQLLQRLLWAVSDAEAAEAGLPAGTETMPARLSSRAPAMESLYFG